MAEPQANILNLTWLELETWMRQNGLEPYRSRQIFQWLYKKSATDFEQMTDLPKDLRTSLKNRFYFQVPKIIAEKRTRDGTVKFLFELEDQERIEAVMIPDQEQKENTLCLSSQAGCKFACGFCYTGTISFKRNLTSAEILGQYFSVQGRLPGRAEIHRLVFMGMGEPLDNFEELSKAIGIFTSRKGLDLSPRRITISSAGITPLIPQAWSLGVNLAVSINSADPGKRARLMPLSRKYPLPELAKALKLLDTSGRQKLTAEYVMLKGFNDSIPDARGLARLLGGLKIMINLIRFHSFPGCEFEPSAENRILAFQDHLKQAGFMVFIRKSKGKEILAACGQLTGRGE